MNFKGLSYRTEWIEYPDIEALAKKIGALPTTKKTDGRDHYTLPIIYDPSTQTVIADSTPIALYLEKTYPSPPLFPPNTLNLTVAFPAALGTQFSAALFQIVIYHTWKNLNDAGRTYFRETREADFGKKLEDFAPEGDAGKPTWDAAEAAFNTLNRWFTAAGTAPETTFISGNQIGYADLVIAARLIWARVVFGSDSKEWATIATWNDGKWGKYLKHFEKYETVV